jgi:hypothetical protein
MSTRARETREACPCSVCKTPVVSCCARVPSWSDRVSPRFLQQSSQKEPSVRAQLLSLKLHQCTPSAAAAAVKMGPKRPEAPPGAWQQRQTAALWTYRQEVESLRRRDAEDPPPPPPFPRAAWRGPTAAPSSSSAWAPPPPPPAERGLQPPTSLAADPREEMTQLRYGGVLALGFATQRFAVMTHGRPVVAPQCEEKP